MQHSPRLTARFYHILTAIKTKQFKAPAEMRVHYGFNSDLKTFSATFTQAKEFMLLTSKAHGPRNHSYVLTDSGEAYLEALTEAEIESLATVEEAFAKTPNYPERASKVAEPVSEIENAAISGIAALIDENKRLRSMLTRFSIEIANSLQR